MRFCDSEEERVTVKVSNTRVTNTEAQLGSAASILSRHGLRSFRRAPILSTLTVAQTTENELT